MEYYNILNKANKVSPKQEEKQKIYSKEKVVEKTGEIVLGAVINKLNGYKNKKEWSKLFIDVGEFFLK